MGSFCVCMSNMILPSKEWCFNTIDDNTNKTWILQIFCHSWPQIHISWLTPGTRIYSMDSSPAYLPTFYTSSNFLGPSISYRVSIVQLINSFSIYLVRSIFPPNHMCNDDLAKDDYAVCSQEFLRSSPPPSPHSFPRLLKIHRLWLSLTFWCVPMSIIYLARRYWP